MNLFDVIGPVMIGPSSSHTAGAARIGNITRKLLNSPPKHVDIGLHGSFQKTYIGHGTDRALIGGLLGMEVDDERLRDSLQIANEVGFSYEFHEVQLRNVHPNTVVLKVEGTNGNVVNVQASSVGGGEIVIQEINGLKAEFNARFNTVVISYFDLPGMIANISNEFAMANINIGTMKVFRQSIGGNAMVVIEIDGEADERLLSRLRSLPDIEKVAYLEIGEGN